jgi:hypothetical protein
MRARPYTVVAVSTAIAVSAVLFAAACESYKEWIDPDTVKFDAAIDYGLAPQVTHFGPNAVTCCLDTPGNGIVLYLANPQPSSVDPRTGRDKPPQGELHIATPYGVDFTLGQKVPAFGYGFSPDGTTGFYLTGVADGTFALNAIRVNSPDLRQPNPKVVIPAGLDNSSLFGQSEFSATANYLLAFVHPQGADTNGAATDIHVISVIGAEDVMQIKNTTQFYTTLFAPNDVLIYEADTAARQPGQVNVPILKMLNLQAGIGGAPPVEIDRYTTQQQLSADGSSLFYIRQNGDLVVWDLKDQDYQVIAKNVTTYSLGPSRRGPVLWVQSDLSVHVAEQQRPEMIPALPPNSFDVFSPLIFAPNKQHFYFFKNTHSDSNYGDLYHVALPPAGKGELNLVSVRVSMRDFYFSNDHFQFVRNVSTTGDWGDLVDANLDGSNQQVMAPGVACGNVQIAYPRPYAPPQQQPGGFYPGLHPPDLSVVATAPVFANLTNATRDTATTLKFVTSTKPVTGALAYGPQLGQQELLVNDKVHFGQFQFSDDGYVLLYVGNATYQASAFNYVGSLQMFQTNNNVGPVVPMLDGVAEIGPIVDRTLFVSAPGAMTPGMYFIKY